MTSGWNSKTHHHPPDRPSLMVSAAWYTCNSTVLLQCLGWPKHGWWNTSIIYPTNYKQSTWLILTRLVNCNFSKFLPNECPHFPQVALSLSNFHPEIPPAGQHLKAPAAQSSFVPSTFQRFALLTSPCRHLLLHNIKGHCKHPNTHLPFMSFLKTSRPWKITN